MTVSEYERRFRELSDFCPNLVADEVSKKRRFLDGLSEPIALPLRFRPSHVSVDERRCSRGGEIDPEMPDYASIIRWIVFGESQSWII